MATERIPARLKRRLVSSWRRFWLRRGGYDRLGRLATRLGSVGAGSFRSLVPLAGVAPAKGFTAPSAEIIGVELNRGSAVFIGERVVIARWAGTGCVELGRGVQLNREINIELFEGGEVRIGDGTAIQPRCQFTSAVQPIEIGNRVQIAPQCAFYSFDHSIEAGRSMMEQPLTSKGPLIIEDDAWVGYGAIVLSGVRIGQGAVIGAGAVVTRDVPANGIAVGNPARVVKMREAATDFAQIVQNTGMVGRR